MRRMHKIEAESDGFRPKSSMEFGFIHNEKDLLSARAPKCFVHTRVVGTAKRIKLLFEVFVVYYFYRAFICCCYTL